MTDYYDQHLKRAGWTWMEGRPRRKDRVDGRAEKRSARAAERREIDDQLLNGLHPGDDQWCCACDCCAFYVPGLGLVPKRGSWLY